MDSRLHVWLGDRGIGQPETLAPVQAGLGDTMLWKVSQPGNERDLLIRMFSIGADKAAAREVVAMKEAAQHGVPVPEIVLLDDMDGQPVLIITWCPGEPAREVLQRSPQDAWRIGTAMGEALGQLHRLTAPTHLAPTGRWIERGGAALRPIRDQLERVPDANRLLHLDFHPNNVLIDDGKVSAIIDWANTLPGPPHMDVARSRAILRSVRVGGLMPATMATVLDRFEEGLVAGHTDVIGPDPHPELSAAWGMAMTVDDLAGHVGKPENWVTETVLERLRDERDRLIAAVMLGT